MDALRELFQAMGFSNVETFIASGNVIFDGPPDDSAVLEKKIERGLKEALGYQVATFLRRPAEVVAITGYRPFSEAELAEAGSQYIAFLPAPPGAEAREKLMDFCDETNNFHIHGREVYWLIRTKISQSNFSGAQLEKALGMPATMRNITTVKKLAARYGTQ